ncbi:MAG TPA: ABC transporter permease [Anaerolineales bacterium]|jgi:peptide/nickel transport system permease protein|nr:ABC transporter permease [Anaerolineales bacterium]
MEIAPEALTPFQRQRYLWRLRLRLLRRNSLDFVRQLGAHPLPLLSGIVIVVYLLAAILAPQITAHDPTRGNLRLRLDPPAWEEGGGWSYPLGTDSQGRDLLTRIIYGARVSLLVGLLSVGISVIIGLLTGTLAGYFRGRFDSLISRFADLLLAFPFLIFAIGVMAFLGPGFANLVLALTFKGWVEFFRLVRGEMLAEKTQEYVEAARATGQSHLAIITSEILPNIIQSVFVLGTLRMGYMIIMEASLSFLGLGIPPRIPAWGSMVAEGRDYMLVAWWVSTFPGLAIVVLVLAINLFGEGLRDILDPRLKIEA